MRCDARVIFHLMMRSKIQRALRELGRLTLAAVGQQEMVQLGGLVPEAVDKEDMTVQMHIIAI